MTKKDKTTRYFIFIFVCPPTPNCRRWKKQNVLSRQTHTFLLIMCHTQRTAVHVHWWVYPPDRLLSQHSSTPHPAVREQGSCEENHVLLPYWWLVRASNSWIVVIAADVDWGGKWTLDALREINETHRGVGRVVEDALSAVNKASDFAPKPRAVFFVECLK